MLASCLRMRLEESGRLLIFAMIPATKGRIVAAPAPISATAVRWRDRLIELVSDQQADTEADRSLRKRNDARHREVVAKFIE